MTHATTLPRRRFIRLAATALALPALPRLARAQAYPTRPVRMIVPFPAGGPADLIARLIGQSLSEQLGQPVIVENRAGAASNLGTEAVAHAAPDGYTLLLAVTSQAINATLYEKLNYSFVRDIAPVGGIMRVPHVMEVSPTFPPKTVPEFIAYAKANPGKINMASGGNGSGAHVAGELFKMMTGVNLVHVPYRSEANAVPDLIAGQVHIVFAIMSGAMGNIRSGKVRALAVTTKERSPELPDLPPVADFVPGYEVTSWQGIGAPKGTPKEIVDKLNKALNASLEDPKIKSRIVALGGTALTASPDEFGRLIVDETEKWSKVVKFSGAKVR
jgi:tripartite-type tricarboxylate transporter receptor subunit TctC